MWIIPVSSFLIACPISCRNNEQTGGGAAQTATIIIITIIMFGPCKYLGWRLKAICAAANSSTHFEPRCTAHTSTHTSHSYQWNSWNIIFSTVFSQPDRISYDINPWHTRLLSITATWFACVCFFFFCVSGLKQMDTKLQSLKLTQTLSLSRMWSVRS